MIRQREWNKCGMQPPSVCRRGGLRIHDNWALQKQHPSFNGVKSKLFISVSEERWIVAVQFHPERKEHNGVITDHFVEVCRQFQKNKCNLWTKLLIINTTNIHLFILNTNIFIIYIFWYKFKRIFIIWINNT